MEREAAARKAIQHTIVYKKRRCLGCGKMFKSNGIGNRVCKKCTLRNESKSGIREFDIMGETDCLVRRKRLSGG